MASIEDEKGDVTHLCEILTDSIVETMRSINEGVGGNALNTQGDD